MKKYPSIDQFRNVIRAVKTNHDYQGKDTETGEPIYQHTSPYPTLTFNGTVKIHGCLDENTLITLANGEMIPIKEITIGTWVLSKNTTTNEIIPNKVINTWNSNSDKNWVELIFDNETRLICTDDHLIWTINRGYIESKNLLPSDIFDTM